MKKKKLILTICIAAFLLVALLFYWNNNEVHACEEVSLEEAREILTEDNLLLEYSNYDYPLGRAARGASHKTVYNTTSSRAKKEICTLIVCRDGAVFYCSYHLEEDELPDTTLENIHSGWSNIPAYIYYLGRFSTMDLLMLRCQISFVDMEAEYERMSIDLVEMEPEAAGSNELGLEYLYESAPLLVEDVGGYAKYCLWNYLSSSCKIYRNSNGEIDDFSIMRNEWYNHHSFLLDSFAEDIKSSVENSDFFEMYAIMAYRELCTRRNPIAEAEERMEVANVVQDTENEVRIWENSANQYCAGRDGHFYYKWRYIGQNVIYHTTIEDMESGEMPKIICEDSANVLFSMDGNVFGLRHGCYFLLKPDGTFVETEMIGNICGLEKVKVFEDTFYCSNYSSLIRMNTEGETEVLWEYAVFSFEVDENYIYIFDGNTWYVLDRITGEELGWIVTDVSFTYEVDEMYAYNENIYFVAWDTVENTISCNSLDMDGNMTQIGEVHTGYESDSYCVTCYEQYIYYSINDCTEIVRVDLNTGEEEKILLEEYGCYRIWEIMPFEDKLMVYVKDNENDFFYLQFNLYSLEDEGILYP